MWAKLNSVSATKQFLTYFKYEINMPFYLKCKSFVIICNNLAVSEPTVALSTLPPPLS